MRYPHLASRIFNTPLLIHPQKLDAIIAGLGPRLLGAALAPGSDGLGESDLLAPELFSTRRGERSDGGYRVSEGVALVHVMGALAHRTKLDAESNFILGYDSIATRLENAMEDPEVHAIAAIVDSPGGEAQGAFELAQRTFELRGKKPMTALVDSMALSAGYLFASAAQEVVMTSATAHAGSIGVVMRHVDISRLLANEGIRVEHIYAGAHKIDGNQFEPMSPAVRAAFQEVVNEQYELFVQAIARYTGLAADAVRATEARVFMGEAAVSAGLAKRLASADAVLTELAGRRSRTYPAGQVARSSLSSERKGTSMSSTNAGADGSQSATQPPALTAADVEKARAEGRAEGATQERTRIKAVMALSASMPGHQELVHKLAFESDTPAGEAALQVIAAEGELRAKRGQDHLNDAPGALPLKPSATVRNEGGKQELSRAELDRKAKEYMAANKGVSYVAAVKHIEATQGA
jgi:signal peptide peptidase SppA